MKSADAGIKTNLTNIRVQSALWYDDNGQVYATAGNTWPLGQCPSAVSSGNIFGDPIIFSMVNAAYELSGSVVNTRCVAVGDAWAVAVQLKTSDGAAYIIGPNGWAVDAWCVDSVGNSKSYWYDVGENISYAIKPDNSCRESL